MFRGAEEPEKFDLDLVTEQNVRESLKAIDRGYVLENGRIVLEAARRLGKRTTS